MVAGEGTTVVDLVLPLEDATTQRSIVGRVTLADGRPAPGVRLRLQRRNFGGGTTLLSETTTLAGGRYALGFTDTPTGASLQIVAVRPAGAEVPLDAELNYLGRERQVTREPRRARRTSSRPQIEFSRLAADLAPRWAT